jgi:hypothetical protein
MMTGAKRFFITSAMFLVLASLQVAPSAAAGLSFEECQARAVAAGLRPSSANRIQRKYLRWQAAGTAYHPRGMVARCMSGRS